LRKVDAILAELREPSEEMVKAVVRAIVDADPGADWVNLEGCARAAIAAYVDKSGN
jgi:hypothetical protein